MRTRSGTAAVGSPDAGAAAPAGADVAAPEPGALGAGREPEVVDATRTGVAGAPPREVRESPAVAAASRFAFARATVSARAESCAAFFAFASARATAFAESRAAALASA